MPVTSRLPAEPLESASRFRSILVPLDQSPLAEQAIPVALAIAERTQGKVKLVHVHRELRPLFPLEPRQDYVKVRLAMRKSEREYLRTLTRHLQRQIGRAVSGAMLEGSVARTLAKYVRDIRADIVVMTSHGYGGLRRVWLGSVADELVRTLKVPVLLVRPAENEHSDSVNFSRILVPLDGSPLAEGILEPAVALARLWNAELNLIQIVHPLPYAAGVLPGPLLSTDRYNQVLSRHLEMARAYLQAIAQGLGDRGVSASSRAVVGANVAETLVDLARQEQAGLVALATRGQGGIRRFVLGSVADKLLRAAEVPILVYRPRRRRRRS
jgi:nucleotide-binding universal stress UspA family protein